MSTCPKCGHEFLELTNKRGTRLPPTWNAPADLYEWAKRERPDIDVSKIVREFVDYWSAVPGQKGVKLDWDATFRNWVRAARSTPANRAPPPRPQSPSVPRGTQAPKETEAERNKRLEDNRAKLAELAINAFAGKVNP